MMVIPALVAATFVRVFLLGFQSRLVNRGQWRVAYFTSWGLAAVEAAVLFLALQSNDFFVVFFSCGFGASAGIVTSVWVHRALFGERV